MCFVLIICGRLHRNIVGILSDCHTSVCSHALTAIRSEMRNVNVWRMKTAADSVNGNPPALRRPGKVMVSAVFGVVRRVWRCQLLCVAL